MQAPNADQVETPNALTEDVLLEILISASEIDSIVVGGQALNMWAEVYYDKSPDELRVFAPFESKDIDYSGSKEEALQLSKLLDGKVFIPELDHNTPNSAVVVIERLGKTYDIDFIHTVAGVRSITELKNTAQVISIDPKSDGNLTNVRLMHPLLVMKTRVAGVTVLKRRDLVATRQLGASPVVLREYIRENLDYALTESNVKIQKTLVSDMQSIISAMIEYGRGRDADVVFTEFGVDILSHAEQLADHKAWDSRFSKHQIENRIATYKGIRKKRLAEQMRRAARLPNGLK